MAAMVDSRCAMAMTVLPFMRLTSCSWIAASTSLVERARRLVEHQDGRILQQHAGDGDALALAAGQLHAALADVRVIAPAALQVLEVADEIVRRGFLGGARGIGLPASDWPSSDRP